MAQLVTAAAQGDEDYTGIAARGTASGLRELADAVRGVAAASSDADVRSTIINNADEVMDHSLELIERARYVLKHADEPDRNRSLTRAVKEVSQALDRCVGCLPGQKDVDDAIHGIADAASVLDEGRFPSTEKSYGSVQV